MIDLIPVQYRLIAVAIAVAVAAAIGFGAGWTTKGWQADAKISGIERDIATQREQAIEAALGKERKQQEVANNAIKEQMRQLDAINSDLSSELYRLRKRQSRTAERVPAPPGVTCPSGTGAELYREDAEFLIREAARADELRAGLEACYRVIDGMKK